MTLVGVSKLVVLLLTISMLAVLMPPGAAEGASLPSPVAPTAVAQGAAVQLNWSAPTTSSGVINQTGCDSANQSMSYIYQNFSRGYPSIVVVLKGGGNNYGFAQWIAGNSDVDQASRKITDAEAQGARAAGINVTETRVGVECIAIIVHPSVGVDALTTDQLRGIFNGSVKNWKEIGGTDEAVTVFGPEAALSPHLFFTNTVMVGTDYTNVHRIADPIEMGRWVANTSGAIGFLRSGYLANISGAKVIELSGTSGQPVSPQNLSAVYNNQYPLSRYFSLYTNGTLTGRIGAWAHYILDPDNGQRIMTENGFLRLNESERTNSLTHIVSTSDDPVLRYNIYRQSGGSRTLIAQVTNTTGYRDASPTDGGNTYWISAVYSSGEGALTSPLNVTVSASPGSGNLPLPGGGPGNFAYIVVLAMLGIIAVLAVIRLRRR